jgi:hypothetical protein
MGEQAMTLREEDIQRVGEYIKPWIRELVDRIVPRPAVAGIDAQLLERMVRVEEELKAQRELMDERFEFTRERFEAVDRRFDDVRESFKRTQWFIGIGFVIVTAVITLFGVLA